MKKSLALILSCVAASQAFASSLPEPKFGFSIERLVSFPILNGRSPAGASMSPDGTKIVFAWNKTGVRKRDLWIMDFPSGSMKQIQSAEDIPFLPNQDDARTDEDKKEQETYDGGFGGGAIWSPDSKEFLLPYRGRYWIYDREGTKRAPLFNGGLYVSSPDYSPDGQYLLMVYEGNVLRMDRKTGDLRQLTFITKPGTSVDSFSISPDSKTLAVGWSDSTKYGRHVMMDFTKERSEVRNILRMWQGNKAVDVQLGLVGIDGGMVKFINSLPRFHWLMAYSFSPDSSQIAIGWKSEDHQEFTVTHAFVKDAIGRNVFTEKAPSNYINNWRPMDWTRDGKGIMLGTDLREGKWSNRSIALLNPNGKVEKWLYAKNHCVGNFMRPKFSDQVVMTTLSNSSLRSEIRVLKPNGEETTYVIEPNGMSVPTDFEDTGLPMVSADGSKIATLAENPTRNPELYSVEPKVQRLTTSQLPEFEKIKWADIREVTFPGPDGVPIKAQLITRPGLDLTKKHPAVISDMYANSAKMTWSGYLANYMAMELDFVVLKVDFRASWGQGGEFNSGYFEKMGLIDSKEAVEAKKFLVNLGYVKPDRVGVWGWSYGGFLTCMIMMTQPGEFHAGVAVASVTEWKNYNHWYTTQRLGFYDQKKKVYEETSPITHAAKLEGNLMLVHGMLDDNVLFQDSARLAMELIDKGKRFDQFYYPRDDHGISRVETRPHVMRTIVQYLYDKLSQ